MLSRIAALVCIALTGAGAARAQDSTPDETLWASIAALARATPASEPFEARFAAELARRRTLLEKTQSYLRIYPGGARRDEAIALELETIFEIASVSGDFAPLAARISALNAAPPSDASLAEAAWWQIHCDRAQATSTRPEANTLETGDRDVLAAYRGYVQKFPQSRHTLRALVRLADDALSRGNIDEAGSFVSILESRFSGNALANGAVARLRLARNVGQPFSVKLRSIDGAEIDTAAYAGHIVLICVWDSSRSDSAEFAKQISAFRAETQSSRVVGVCIADSVEATRRAVQLLGIAWPQCNDGLGRGGEFVRHWGVRTTPTVLVVDRLGRLAGCGDARSWRALADRAATTPQSPAR